MSINHAYLSGLMDRVIARNPAEPEFHQAVREVLTIEELGHEALAEAHDLQVRAALGVEVAAPLAAADGQAGEAVFEDLLEPQARAS